jgi:hypothetical protein
MQASHRYWYHVNVPEIGIVMEQGWCFGTEQNQAIASALESIRTHFPTVGSYVRKSDITLSHDGTCERCREMQHVADGTEDSVSLVVATLLGKVRYRLRVANVAEATARSGWATVIDDAGNQIGHATRIYSDGWSVQTKPFGGYVNDSQVEIVVEGAES